MNANWAEEVLAFWYGHLTVDDWFEVKPATDRAIVERFTDLQAELAEGIPHEVAHEQRAALAAVIVCDQFPRNMFRGTPRAFATDTIALTIARNALDAGLDDGLSKEQRQFLYMPFMHSEIIADQERSVMLFKTLGEDLVKFAIEHRDIVARFGRFPHRNAILGRPNTPEETAFLKEHKGFGQ